MQIVIELDAETARQLETIQKYTNQDHASIVKQSIGLYHQQLQPHCELFFATAREYNLVGSAPVHANAN